MTDATGSFTTGGATGIIVWAALTSGGVVCAGLVSGTGFTFGSADCVSMSALPQRIGATRRLMAGSTKLTGTWPLLWQWRFNGFACTMKNNSYSFFLFQSQQDLHLPTHVHRASWKLPVCRAFHTLRIWTVSLQYGHEHEASANICPCIWKKMTVDSDVFAVLYVRNHKWRTSAFFFLRFELGREKGSTLLHKAGSEASAPIFIQSCIRCFFHETHWQQKKKKTFCRSRNTETSCHLRAPLLCSHRVPSLCAPPHRSADSPEQASPCASPNALQRKIILCEFLQSQWNIFGFFFCCFRLSSIGSRWTDSRSTQRTKHISKWTHKILTVETLRNTKISAADLARKDGFSRVIVWLVSCNQKEF